MRTLVIYDSVFGNTEKIALEIVRALSAHSEVETRKISSVKGDDLNGIDLLVVGSPTRGFRPTKPISDWVKSLPAGKLKGVKIAAFDTRLSQHKIDTSPWILKILVKIYGYAAAPLSKSLVNLGGIECTAPMGFDVADSEGPILSGEMERAAHWAAELCKE